MTKFEKIKSMFVEDFFKMVVQREITIEDVSLIYSFHNKGDGKSGCTNCIAKEIITKYRVIAKKSDSSLLEVELLTGRTHQIRAHMAFIGHSLLGDGKYGVNRDEKRKGYKHQALYAYRLVFDVTKSENPLSYLEGKEFSIDKKGIWFLKDFE